MSLVGIVLAAVGTVPFALAGPRTSDVLLVAALLVRGAGLGAATIALMAGAFQGLSKAQIPHASSATRIAQQIGGAFGAAVLVVILSGQARQGSGLAGLTVAFDHTFWWCIGFSALAVLPALLMAGRPRVPDTGRSSAATATDSSKTRAAVSD